MFYYYKVESLFHCHRAERMNLRLINVTLAGYGEYEIQNSKSFVRIPFTKCPQVITWSSGRTVTRETMAISFN
jgi:hypothetical protein